MKIYLWRIRKVVVLQPTVKSQLSQRSLRSKDILLETQTKLDLLVGLVGSKYTTQIGYKVGQFHQEAKIMAASDILQQ